MLRYLYCQRRRIAFGIIAGLFLLQLAIADWFSDELIESFGQGLFVQGGTLFLMGIIFAFFISLFVLILPRFRHMVEILMTTCLFEQITRLFFPGPYATLDMWELGFLPFMAFLFLLISAYEGWLPIQMPNWFSYKSSAKVKINSDPEQIWAAAIPTREAPQRYYVGTMSLPENQHDDPESLNVRYALGSGAFELQEVNYIANEKGVHGRYHFMNDVSAQNREFNEGFFDLKFEKQVRSKHVVRVELDYPALPLSAAIMKWLDDDNRDRANSIKAWVENRLDYSNFGRFRKLAMKYS